MAISNSYVSLPEGTIHQIGSDLFSTAGVQPDRCDVARASNDATSTGHPGNWKS